MKERLLDIKMKPLPIIMFLMQAKNTYRPIDIIDKLTQQSYGILFLLWFAIAFTFGLLYFLLLISSPENGPGPISPESGFLSKFLNCLYFSIITATSTGYGDLAPGGISKLFASIQSVIALVVFAVFVSKLVSYKQEFALGEIHKLTFEEVVHHIREGLYIVRKDCDRLIENVIQKEKLDHTGWTDLKIIYRHTQSLLQKIPHFYATSRGKMGFYTIDRDRETLLHEAVFRTLTRIQKMLIVFETAKIDWNHHAESRELLAKIVHLIDTITPNWTEESPYREDFGDITKINSEIKKLLG